ncbi:MAG: dTDP-4-dehydrorhamnose reductase [Solirubrobacteraceae bacterium]
MRLLITGAGGMLGRDVRAAAQAAGHETVAVPRAELDIANSAAVDSVVADAHPELVVNCAAWTDVDGAEADYERALAVNGPGAGHVARAAAAAGAWTLHVSSDYVFSGAKRGPYLESDPVGPASGYGRSKLAGERAVAEAAPRAHTIVRSSWLFGVTGHCFPRTILRLAAERDQLNVVADQVGCPTFTGHLAEALVALAATQPLGVLHVAAAGECSWFDFASEIVGARSLDCQVCPCTTDEFPRPAPRPAYSVLRSQRGSLAPALPHWRDGLSAYLAAAREAVA